MLVLFGNSSGPVPPFDVLQLSRGGSLYVTRPILGHYISTPDEWTRRTADLVRWLASGTRPACARHCAATLTRVRSGELRVHFAPEFALEDAADAHRRIADRSNVGKVRRALAVRAAPDCAARRFCCACERVALRRRAARVLGAQRAHGREQVARCDVVAHPPQQVVVAEEAQAVAHVPRLAAACTRRPHAVSWTCVARAARAPAKW